MSFPFLLLCMPSLVFAFHNRGSPPSPLWRRAPPAEGYYSPLDNGGGMLAIAGGTGGLGEPINVILSGASDSAVLVDTEINGGLRNYFVSFGFSSECLGQHDGNSQLANLGDGNGPKNETAVIRWNYGDPKLGTCKETISGGNHFRYWVQNGPNANSGAVFMAASYEKPIAQQHDIVPNGYNFGRDQIVGNVTSTQVPTTTLTNASTFSGQTTYGGYTYQTYVKYVSGLLQNTSSGINHASTVAVDGQNAIDGLVAVLSVTITQRPQAPLSSAQSTSPLRTWHLLALFFPSSLFLFSLSFL